MGEARTKANQQRDSASRVRRSLAAGAAVIVAVGATIAILAIIRDRDGDSSSATGAPAAAGYTGGDFHSIVVDPTNPERIFVGGHQAVSESTDGGGSWTEINTLRDADAMGWAFIDDHVYVSGHPGLTLSTDAAHTFERTNDGLPDTDLHALGGTDDILYAAGPAVGVGARDEATGEWEQLTANAGQSFFGRILVDPTDPQHLLAADAANGVVQSIDGGRQWQAVPAGLDTATWLSSAGPDGQTIVASGPAGAARSSDGGATWEPLDLPSGGTLVELAPDDPNTMYVGIHSDDGVHLAISTDAGRTWARP